MPWVITLPSMAAAHYERAGKLEQAAAYERRAAEVAHRLYANLDAIAHYQRALALLGTGHLAHVDDHLVLCGRGRGQRQQDGEYNDVPRHASSSGLERVRPAPDLDLLI
jgi:hypothetical protein